MNTGAVIVAAGMSSRMGDFKPMMQAGSISIIQRLIRTLQIADVYPIVVVTGNRASELEKHISKLDVVFVRNENYQNSQMFDSAKLGMSYIADKCDRFFFMPVDVPFFTANTLEALINSSYRLATPICDGKEGHPMIIGSELVGALLDYKGNHGLYGATEDCGCEKMNVEVEDRAILHDMDTSGDYKELLAWHNKHLFHPKANVELLRETVCFTKETYKLLYFINTTGSMTVACKEINLSYSKGWKLINAAEKELGFPIVKRNHGGRDGGSTHLSRMGQWMLEKYALLEKAANEAILRAFEEHFSDIL